MTPLVPPFPIREIRQRTGAAVCALLAAAACAFAQPNTQKMNASSVMVYGMNPRNEPVSRGGAVVLDARHVIADIDLCCGKSEGGEQLSPRVERGGYMSAARMVWRSPDHDMVILELERPIDLPGVSIAPSKLVSSGQTVYTVNFSPPPVGDPRIQEGRLGEPKKFQNKNLAMHTATTPMDRLNIGGGLFDACGNLIGITVRFKEGELLAWLIEGIGPGLKEAGINSEIASSACGGGGGGSQRGGDKGGEKRTEKGGEKTGEKTGETGNGVGGFFSKLTTGQWIAVGVIVGIFALGFRPATRQTVVRAMTRRRSSLPEPLPYPYGGHPPPPPSFGAGPPPVGPPPVGPPPVGPPPVYGGMPPPAYPPAVAPQHPPQQAPYQPPYQAAYPPPGAPPPYGAPMPPPSPPAPLLAGRPALVGLVGQYAGSSIALDAGPSTLGRDHSNVNLVFPAEANAISKRHCRVSWDIARRVFVLEDLGSTNGTFLASGERVNPGQPRDLRPGDRFHIGDLRNQFEVRMES